MAQANTVDGITQALIGEVSNLVMKESTFQVATTAELLKQTARVYREINPAYEVQFNLTAKQVLELADYITQLENKEHVESSPG